MWDRITQLIKRRLSDHTGLNRGNLGKDEAKAEPGMHSLTDRIFFFGFAADRNVFRVRATGGPS